jgi:hypothetical protein
LGEEIHSGDVVALAAKTVTQSPSSPGEGGNRNGELNMLLGSVKEFATLTMDKENKSEADPTKVSRKHGEEMHGVTFLKLGGQMGSHLSAGDVVVIKRNEKYLSGSSFSDFLHWTDSVHSSKTHFIIRMPGYTSQMLREEDTVKLQESTSFVMESVYWRHNYIGLFRYPCRPSMFSPLQSTDLHYLILGPEKKHRNDRTVPLQFQSYRIRVLGLFSAISSCMTEGATLGKQARRSSHLPSSPNDTQSSAADTAGTSPAKGELLPSLHEVDDEGSDGEDGTATALHKIRRLGSSLFHAVPLLPAAAAATQNLASNIVNLRQPFRRESREGNPLSEEQGDYHPRSGSVVMVESDQHYDKSPFIVGSKVIRAIQSPSRTWQRFRNSPQSNSPLEVACGEEGGVCQRRRRRRRRSYTSEGEKGGGRSNGGRRRHRLSPSPTGFESPLRRIFASSSRGSSSRGNGCSGGETDAGSGAAPVPQLASSCPSPTSALAALRDDDGGCGAKGGGGGGIVGNASCSVDESDMDTDNEGSDSDTSSLDTREDMGTDVLQEGGRDGADGEDPHRLWRFTAETRHISREKQIQLLERSEEMANLFAIGEEHGWHLAKDEGGARAYTQSQSNSESVCIRAEGVVECRAAQFFDFIADPRNVQLYNHHCAKYTILDKLSNEVEIGLSSYKSIWPTSPREFLFLLMAKPPLASDGIGMMTSASVQDLRYPETPGYVRGTVEFSCYSVRETPEEPETCQFVIISQSNPGGIVPKQLVNKLSVNGPWQLVRNLQDLHSGKSQGRL